jgi:hypothetical protein
VRFHNTGAKQFHHPVVGELSLSYNRLDLAADHGLTIFTYAPSLSCPVGELATHSRRSARAGRAQTPR